MSKMTKYQREMLDYVIERIEEQLQSGRLLLKLPDVEQPLGPLLPDEPTRLTNAKLTYGHRLLPCLRAIRDNDRKAIDEVFACCAPRYRKKRVAREMH